MGKPRGDGQTTSKSLDDLPIPPRRSKRGLDEVAHQESIAGQPSKKAKRTANIPVRDKAPSQKHKSEKEEDGSLDLDNDTGRVDAGPPKRNVPRKQKKSGNSQEVRSVSVTLNVAGEGSISKKRTPKTKIKSDVEVEEIETLKANADSQEDVPGPVPLPESEPKKRRKRKTKEEKEAEAMPLAARTQGLKMFVGAHVSMAKGVQNAVTNCVHIGGNAFALFLQSQRKWENPPLLDENRDLFHSHCKEHRFDQTSHVLPHGSYLVNLAQEDKTRLKQAYDFFIGDLQRCEALGIKLYNFHPGACSGTPLPEAIKRLATQLNCALKETKFVTLVLENMAGSGSVIGSRFSDLRDIIAQIKPEYRSRIGVCLDTCHAFAAGYDLRTPSSFRAVLQDFDDTVGLSYLKGLHINDSKAPFDSKRDLHQNIGLGFLGLRAFHNVMNEPRFQNLPLVLETSCDRPDPEDPTGKKMVEDKHIWAREIKLLESLIGMDAEGEEFKELEAELSEQGREDRDKVQKQFDALQEKKRKKLEKGQKTLLHMMDGGKRKGCKSSTASSLSSELSELADEDFE